MPCTCSHAAATTSATTSASGACACNGVTVEVVTVAGECAVCGIYDELLHGLCALCEADAIVEAMAEQQLGPINSCEEWR